MLLGTLGASLLGNILAGKGAIATSQGRGIYRAILKYKNIIKINQDSMVFILEIIYPK